MLFLYSTGHFCVFTVSSTSNYLCPGVGKYIQICNHWSGNHLGRLIRVSWQDHTGRCYAMLRTYNRCCLKNLSWNTGCTLSLNILHHHDGKKWCLVTLTLPRATSCKYFDVCKHDLQSQFVCSCKDILLLCCYVLQW